MAETPVIPTVPQSPAAAVPAPIKKPFPLWIIWVIITLLLATAAGFAYKYFQLKQAAVPQPSPIVIASPSPALAPSPTPSPTADPTAGWKIYKNTQYGFEFSYPEGYKVLTDSENLYGWPKAILLLYKGGQSYDLAVEVWDSAKPDYDLNVKIKDGRFIALKNLNKDPEVAEIIATFKLSD